MLLVDVPMAIDARFGIVMSCVSDQQKLTHQRKVPEHRFARTLKPDTVSMAKAAGSVTVDQSPNTRRYDSFIFS
jgi:hypothetical protein